VVGGDVAFVDYYGDDVDDVEAHSADTPMA